MPWAFDEKNYTDAGFTLELTREPAVATGDSIVVFSRAGTEHSPGGPRREAVDRVGLRRFGQWQLIFDTVRRKFSVCESIGKWEQDGMPAPRRHGVRFPIGCGVKDVATVDLPFQAVEPREWPDLDTGGTARQFVNGSGPFSCTVGPGGDGISHFVLSLRFASRLRYS